MKKTSASAMFRHPRKKSRAEIVTSLMKITTVITVAVLSAAIARAADEGLTLKNKFVSWHGNVSHEKLQPLRVEDRLNGGSLALANDCFRVELGDGTVLRSSDFKLVNTLVVESLKPQPDSSVAARHEAGRQLVASFSAPDKHLSAEWRVILRDGSAYVREELTLRAIGEDVMVKEIVLFDQKVPGAKTIGSVEGSPVVADNFFVGYEHPMANNVVGADSSVRCGFVRNAILRAGETLAQSCVVGVVPHGQLRRGFLAYVERERAHPYRPFLHYNSWYDIAWDNRKYDEAESLNAIDHFGHELVEKRGVKMDSFLFDDGWDDNQTLWKLHSGFPNGFTPLKTEAAKFHAGIGVWVSPFGGYNTAKAARLAYGSQFGFETNSSGFSLAGPKYFKRFHEIVMEMAEKYGVNQFKFDGLAAGGKAAANGLTRDGDAMLRMIGDLRVATPDIYISQTVGTWPSPFWLLYVDSTWRAGADHSFSGKGSPRQQWITYRDTETFKNVVQRGPLYPLNSLMLHGIIYATNADKLTVTGDSDFADEVREFFGTGTQLQEMYITPSLMNAKNWDDLAEAANWSRANADVLVDSHWIGGDPGKNEVYGWASWNSRRGILVLRNPDDQPAAFSADPGKCFELPGGAPKTFHLHSPWKQDTAQSEIKISAGQPHTFQLKPFEVLVLETK
jgi:hypothetical protein